MKLARLLFLFLTLALASVPPASGQEGVPLGLGVAAPYLTPEQPLYFYTLSSPVHHPGNALRADSVTFRQGKHHVEIASAPPWLVPEELVLDYDAFLLRIVTVSQNWLEVVVNMSEELPRSTPRTMWVLRNAVEFYPWAEFLPNVAFVEPLDPQANPVRVGPDEETDRTAHAPALRPIALQGDWLLVFTDSDADRVPPLGWIRWRAPDPSVTGGYRLLIAYSLRA